MVQMQNLQSAAADLITASGQMNTGTSVSGQGTDTFSEMLKSSSGESSAFSKSSAKDDLKSYKSNDAEPSKKAESKDSGRKEASGSKEDSKTEGKSSDAVASKDARTDSTVENGEGAYLLGAELIAVMNAADQGAIAQLSVADSEVVVAEMTGELVETVAEAAVDTLIDASAGEQTAVNTEVMETLVSQETTTADTFGTSVQKGSADTAAGQAPAEETLSQEKPVEVQTTNGRESNASEGNGEQAQAKADTNAKQGDQVKIEVKDTALEDAAADKLQADMTSVNQTRGADVTQVKVSDGAQLESQVTAQVADSIVAKISEGIQEFELTLTPESLGTVQIKLVFENGKAQVYMNCSDADVQKALANNAAAVKQIIESNTGSQTTVVVETDDDKMGSYEDQREQDGQQGQHEEQQDDSDSEAETMSFIQQLRLGLVNTDETI